MSFTSWLKKVGEDIKKGLDFILPIAETAGEVAVQAFAPSLGPLFNRTVQVVAMAEQNAVALGQSSGSGTQKLAGAVAIAGGVIKQALEDAGRPSSEAEVEKYISAVVTILNAVPASSSTASTPVP